MSNDTDTMVMDKPAGKAPRKRWSFSARCLAARISELVPASKPSLEPLLVMVGKGWNPPVPYQEAVEILADAASFTDDPDRLFELGALRRYLDWEMSTDDVWSLSGCGCDVEMVAQYVPADADLAEIRASHGMWFSRLHPEVRDEMFRRLVAFCAARAGG